MKTIEQKAKAYDEAIKKIKYVMEHGVQPVLNKEDLQGIFPELQESEDERIRKTLIDFFNRGAENGAQTNGVYDKDILAWLEKLKVFSEHGYGLYYFGNNGFAYVGNPTCDNVSWLEKQGKKTQGKSALEAIKEKPANNANKVEPKFKVKYAGSEYVRKDALVKKACEWLYQRQAVDLEVSDIEKFIMDFKKAMEGGEE